MTGPKRSLRTTLTVWNAAALTGLMGAFSLALVLTNQNRLRAAIDDDLVRQAERAARNGPPRPPGMRGMDPRAGFEEPNPPPGQDGPEGGPDPFRDAERLRDVRRPRFFQPDGVAMPVNFRMPAFDTEGLRKSLRGEPNFRVVEMNGESVRVYSRPIYQGGRLAGAVQFARELREVNMLWEAQTRTLALLLPLAVAVAAGGAYLFTNRALRPLRRLTLTAAEISHSDLSGRLEVTGDDEFAHLGRTINQMLARLEQSFTQLESAYSNLTKAYEQQQRFTADASHELRTPLTRLRLATSAALTEATTPEQMRDAIVVADRAANSMSRLVQQLLTLARADSGELALNPEPTDLRVVVAEALESLPCDRPIETHFSERPVTVLADGEHVARVVINLVENAIRYTPVSGRIRVETSQVGNEALIEVRDTGEGIAAEHLPHLFDRFYRVDSARARQDGGSGLGLAICQNLVQAHGGRIEVESKVGSGTSVRAFFPIFSPTRDAQIESS